MKELLVPKTGADSTKKIHINNDRYVSVSANNLAGAETVSFHINQGGTWAAPVPAIELTATENYIQLAGPNTYLAVKSVTAGACGIYQEGA